MILEPKFLSQHRCKSLFNNPLEGPLIKCGGWVNVKQPREGSVREMERGGTGANRGTNRLSKELNSRSEAIRCKPTERPPPWQ